AAPRIGAPITFTGRVVGHGEFLPVLDVDLHIIEPLTYTSIDLDHNLIFAPVLKQQGAVFNLNGLLMLSQMPPGTSHWAYTADSLTSALSLLALTVPAARSAALLLTRLNDAEVVPECLALYCSHCYHYHVQLSCILGLTLDFGATSRAIRAQWHSGLEITVNLAHVHSLIHQIYLIHQRWPSIVCRAMYEEVVTLAYPEYVITGTQAEDKMISAALLDCRKEAHRGGAQLDNASNYERHAIWFLAAIIALYLPYEKRVRIIEAETKREFGIIEVRNEKRV
ncbi:hypothetical protein U1Q18_050853, partial [Sarracenia purpurea var. burkii]